MTEVIDFPTRRTKSTPIVSRTARPAGRELEFERRSSARFLTVFRLAKLVGAQEELCLIRNISAFVLKVEVFSPKAIGSPLGIDFGDNVVRPANVVRRDGDCLGIVLNNKIDASYVLKRIPPPGDRRGRHLRLAVNVDGIVDTKGRRMSCQVVEISQGGARIRTDPAVLVTERIRLELAGLGRLSGSVRWVRNGYAGIAFTRPLPYRQLAGWLPERNRGDQVLPAIGGI